jgi:hypothetical protein
MSRAQQTSTVEQNTGGAVVPVVAGKNVIPNGAMDIWQRSASSYAWTTSVAYGNVDRFCTSQDSTAQGATTQVTSGLPNGFRYGLKLARTASTATSTGLIRLTFALETVASIPLAGQTVTYSFWAKAGANFSAASSQLLSTLYYGTGTDQSVANLNIGAWTGQTAAFSNTASTLTTSWQRFTITASIPSTATQIGFIISYIPVGTANADDSFSITGLQLEQGSVATPFSRAAGTLQGELALAQRYFYTPLNTTTDGLGGSPFLGMGWASSTTTAYILVPFPVTMRAIPSYSYSYTSSSLSITTASYGITTVTSLGADQIMQRNALLSFSASGGGLVAGNAAGVRHDGSGNYIAQFSAEL